MQSASLRERLRASHEVGGGWAYYRGKQPRIEPTSWALIALGPDGDEPLHVGRLTSWQGADGLLRDPGTTDANYGWNGLALLALQQMPDGSVLPAYGPLRSAVLDARGVQLRPAQNAAVPQDGMLQAWSWTPGTFSWLEPSAYCLLALKQRDDSAPNVRARITEAEAVFIDRVCPAGGWNYGNSAVLGQDLRPYVPTTALGLIAMQGRDDDAITRSLAWLEAHAVSERSAMALSLAAIALTLYDRPWRPVVEALMAQEAETGYLDNCHLMAMALFALTLEEHQGRAFRVEPPPNAASRAPRSPWQG